MTSLRTIADHDLVLRLLAEELQRLRADPDPNRYRVAHADRLLMRVATQRLATSEENQASDFRAVLALIESAKNEATR